MRWAVAAPRARRWAEVWALPTAVALAAAVVTVSLVGADGPERGTAEPEPGAVEPRDVDAREPDAAGRPLGDVAFSHPGGVARFTYEIERGGHDGFSVDVVDADGETVFEIAASEGGRGSGPRGGSRYAALVAGEYTIEADGVDGAWWVEATADTPQDPVELPVEYARSGAEALGPPFSHDGGGLAVRFDHRGRHHFEVRLVEVGGERATRVLDGAGGGGGSHGPVEAGEYLVDVAVGGTWQLELRPWTVPGPGDAPIEVPGAQDAPAGAP
jgi:hypothetical protein